MGEKVTRETSQAKLFYNSMQTYGTLLNKLAENIKEAKAGYRKRNMTELHC